MIINFENYGAFGLTFNGDTSEYSYTLKEIMSYLEYKEKQKYPIKEAVIWDYNTGEVVIIVKGNEEG